MSILTCGVSSFIGPLHSAEGGIGIERGRVGGVRIGIGVDDPHQGRARVEQEVWRAMLLEPESVAAMSVSKSYDFHQGCQVAKLDPWIAPPRPPPWRNQRKGRDQILQRSVAEP